ncbi:MAG: hypothetical protein JNL21_18990 [Myxococcales bacterium]|nr:hypothetical protein [Myxococcales bacterium]
MIEERPGFDERFAAAEEGGRSLLVAREARVTFAEPFVLATRCEATSFDLAVRYVTLFAFVVAGVVGVLVVVRAAPAPVAIFAVFWVIAAFGARRWAKRRRSELGRAILDFEAETLTLAPLSGSTRTAPLGDAIVRRETSNDEEAPLWLVLTLRDGTSVRLCRGEERAVDRVLAVLRRFHVEVAKEP